MLHTDKLAFKTRAQHPFGACGDGPGDGRARTNGGSRSGTSVSVRAKHGRSTYRYFKFSRSWNAPLGMLLIWLLLRSLRESLSEARAPTRAGGTLRPLGKGRERTLARSPARTPAKHPTHTEGASPRPGTMRFRGGPVSLSPHAMPLPTH